MKNEFINTDAYNQFVASSNQRKIEERKKILNDPSLLKLHPEFDDFIIGQTFIGEVVYDLPEVIGRYSEIYEEIYDQFDNIQHYWDYCEGEVLKMVDRLRNNALDGQKVPVMVILDYFDSNPTSYQ